MTALGQTPPRSSSAGAAAHRWSGARGGLTAGPTWGRRLSLDVAADSAAAHAEWQRRTPLVVRLRIHPGPGVAACAAVASEAAGGRRHALIGCGDLRCPVRHWAATRGRTCPRTSGRSCTTRGARTSLHWSSPPRTSPPRDTRRTPFSSCRRKSRLYAVSAAAITGLIPCRSDERLDQTDTTAFQTTNSAFAAHAHSCRPAQDGARRAHPAPARYRGGANTRTTTPMDLNTCVRTRYLAFQALERAIRSMGSPRMAIARPVCGATRGLPRSARRARTRTRSSRDIRRR